MKAIKPCFLLSLFVGILLCLTTSSAFALERVFPADLEIGLESRTSIFETSTMHLNHAHELAATLGLGWNPHWLFTVHGHLELGWLALIDENARYSYQNHEHNTSNLWELGLNAAMSFHPASRIVSGTLELAARCYFAPLRAGLFQVHFGIGVGAQPFVDEDSLLRTVRFGVMCRFPVYDDFRDIFDLERKYHEISLQIMWGF